MISAVLFVFSSWNMEGDLLLTLKSPPKLEQKDNWKFNGTKANNFLRVKLCQGGLQAPLFPFSFHAHMKFSELFSGKIFLR